MVRGHTQDGATGPSCVLTSEYKRREEVVWRVRVLDETGKSLDDKGLKSLTVVLSDGEKIDMGYGQHPRGKHDGRVLGDLVGHPGRLPTGTIGYKVVATDTGWHDA